MACGVPSAAGPARQDPQWVSRGFGPTRVEEGRVGYRVRSELWRVRGLERSAFSDPTDDLVTGV